MIQICWIFAVLSFAVAWGCEDSCNMFTESRIDGTGVNHSYTSYWNVTKYSNGAASPDCRNVTTEPTGTWSSSCSWGLTCNPRNSSLILRQISVTLLEGDWAVIKSFAVENLFVSTDSLVALQDISVPITTGASPTYTLYPNVLLTANPSQDVTVRLTLSSPDPTRSPIYRVGVFMNFTCSRIYRYQVADATLPMSTNSGFWSILCAYIIPGIVLAVIIVLALIRKFAPSLVLKLKAWIGITDFEGGARLRHAKIKDRAGGGTWHDHAQEIVSDLKQRRVLEQRAEEDEEEELHSDPEAPIKEASKSDSDEGKGKNSDSFSDSDDSDESDFESDENSDDLL